MGAVQVSVAGEIARTYLLLRGLQSQLGIFEENRQIAQDLLRRAESRQRQGVATRFEAAPARADVAGIEARLYQLSLQRDGLMSALALLLGKGPRELDARLGRAGLPVMPKRLPIGVPSELARARPDIPPRRRVAPGHARPHGPRQLAPAPCRHRRRASLPQISGPPAPG